MDATDAMDPELYKSALAKLFQREKGTSWTTDETMTLIDVWKQQKMQDIIEDNPRDHTPYLAMVDALKRRNFSRTWLQCRVKSRNLTFWYKTVKKRLMLYPDSTMATLKKPQKDLLAQLDPILKNKRIQFNENDLDNGSDQEASPPPSTRVVGTSKDSSTGGRATRSSSSSAAGTAIKLKNVTPSTSNVKVVRVNSTMVRPDTLLIKDEPMDDSDSVVQKTQLPIETSGAKIHLIQPSSDENKCEGVELSNLLPSPGRSQQQSIQQTEIIPPIATISDIFSIRSEIQRVNTNDPITSEQPPTDPSETSSSAFDGHIEAESPSDDDQTRGQKRKSTETETEGQEKKRQRVYEESEGYLFVFEMVDKLLDSQNSFQNKIIELEEKRLAHDERMRKEIQEKEERLRREQTEHEDKFRKEQLQLRLESEERLKKMQCEFEEKQRKERLEWEEKQKREEREHQIKVMHTLAELFHNQNSAT